MQLSIPNPPIQTINLKPSFRIGGITAFDLDSVDLPSGDRCPFQMRSHGPSTADGAVERLSAGWASEGEGPRDNARRLHPDLRRWRALSEGGGAGGKGRAFKAIGLGAQVVPLHVRFPDPQPSDTAGWPPPY